MSNATNRKTLIASSWLAVALAGCVGNLGRADPMNQATPTIRGDGGAAIPWGDASQSTATECGDPVLPARAVLATERQYRNTLRDLLGESAVAELDEGGELLFEVIDRPRMLTSRLDRVLRMAETAIEATRERVDAILGCTDLEDRGCIQEGLSRLGRRAFKRPMSDIELDELMTIYDESLSADLAVMPPSPALDAPPPSGATRCASETETCALPAGVTATVWYGREDGWTARTEVSGAVVCSNAVFGDPFQGSAKACFYLPSDATPSGPEAIERAHRDAITLALTAMLVAPSTLYRTEFQSDPQGLDAHERAAAIAALLLDSVPDEALLAAAADGSLLTAEGLERELTRLLRLPAVRDHLTDVFLHAFNIAKLYDSPKDPMVFPQYTPMLQASMYEESRRVIEDVLWTRGAPLSELLTTRQSFVDPALAEIYGLEYSGNGDEFVPVTLPETRSGLLTQPALMSALSRTDHTSVVARGLFVRGVILCAPKLPAPPAAVQSAVEEQLTADATQTELAAYRASNATCAGCHSQFDRFGLVLERFDAIGAETSAPIEPVDLTGLLDFDGVVNGATGLIDRIANTPQFVDCMTERMLSYALSEAQPTGSLCLPAELATTLHDGDADLATLLGAVIRHPHFALRGEH